MIDVEKTRIVSKPVYEDQTVYENKYVVEDGKAILKKVPVTTQVKKTTLLSVYAEDGGLVMARGTAEKVTQNENGEDIVVPAVESTPMTYPVDVMEDVEETYTVSEQKLNEDGTPAVRLSIRYDQFLILHNAYLLRELNRVKARFQPI